MGVFFGGFQAGMAEKCGNGFDVSSVVEDVDGEGMAGAVPGDVLVDACFGNPVFHGFDAHGVGWQIEYQLVSVAIGRCSDKTKKAVVEREGDATGGGMTFGFALLEGEQAVGEIDVVVGQILDIAEAETAVEAENERTFDIGVHAWIWGCHECEDFVG